MTDLWKLTAVETVARLKKREVSPIDLVEASARRIAELLPWHWEVARRHATAA